MINGSTGSPFSRNQRGSILLSEYVVTFFLVITVVGIMSIYIQRTFQARLRDARHHMISSVNSACDANCMQATTTSADSIAEQYEPYYVKVKSETTRDSLSHKGLLASETGSSGIFKARTSSNNSGSSDSNQLAPAQAVNDIIVGMQ